MTAHLCHAENCPEPVPPRMLMCRRHWYMVPKPDRDLVWQLYTPGQEVTKTPSREYVEHVSKVIDDLAQHEQRLAELEAAKPEQLGLL